jgi:hypothetical protein
MNLYLIASSRPLFPIPSSFLEQAIAKRLPIRPLTEFEAKYFLKYGALPKQMEKSA